MENIVVYWGIIVSIVSAVTVFAINNYMTKKNTNSIEELQNKCNSMMEEKEARREFVTKELYKQQNEHIDKMFKELKDQTNEILRYVRK